MYTIDKPLIEYNQMKIEQLLQLYEFLGFIYPEKRKRLDPVMTLIKENWTKALHANYPLFWVGTIVENDKNIVSTATCWQYLNKGMLGQHLASNHPVGSRLIFLNILQKVIENQLINTIDSYQIYYRPQNKYSARMFEPLSSRLGSDLSQIIFYTYCEVPFIKEFLVEEVEISEVDEANRQQFLEFVQMERGEAYIKAQELDSADLTLERLNKKFTMHGLQRKRSLFMACSKKDSKVRGVIISNQSSLGLNFSFLENSSELILDKSSEKYHLTVARLLLGKASSLFPQFPLNYLPVLVDPVHCRLIEKLQGKVIREYNLFIILRGGYESWYEHADNLTRAIYQRFVGQSYERSVTN
ncbi:hypothetical protein GXP67_05725 [Rhodocytophaga rosea]|uniref:Uncharacterized protein n=1 Tax=Rhodocytophaga rosea TaxID=2704465 RepID=A0A6C0GEU9_9BACT|nr:hypothetical protein [Rhodocytophaga rosea]QHT66200.1 hypothetical protein GXP67_05725 [Rhodocytophaga rosea]